MVVAWLAHSAAIQTVITCGESVAAASDLHRFDLLTALHLPLPADRAAAYAQNNTLSTFLRQKVSQDWWNTLRYEHPPTPPAVRPSPGGSP